MSHAAFDTIIETNPEDAVAHYGRGNVFRDQKLWEDALASYDRALEINPRYALVHFNRGNALYAQKRLKEALAAFDRAIEINSGHSHFHNARGWILKLQNHREEALTAFNRAIEINPRHDVAHNNRGVVLHGQKRMEEALTAYTRAIKINPDFSVAHLNRGIILLDLHRPSEALPCFFRACATNSRKLDPLPLSTSLLTICEKLSELYDAPLLLLRILDCFPFSESSVSWCGKYQEVSERCGWARRLLDSINEKGAFDGADLRLKGLLAYFLGDPILAYDLFDNADDDDDESDDLMLQYYFALTADLILAEDRDGVRSFAVKTARASASSYPLALYYSGLILLEHSGTPEDTEEAARRFTLAASEFLPAKYLQMSALFDLEEMEKYEALCHEIILEEKRLTLRRKPELGYLDPLQSLTLDISVDSWMSQILRYAHASEISLAMERLYRRVEVVWAESGDRLPPEYRFIDKDKPWKLAHAADLFRLSEDLGAKISATEKRYKDRIVDQLRKTLQFEANHLLDVLDEKGKTSEDWLGDKIRKEGANTPDIYQSLIRYAALQDYLDPLPTVKMAFYLAVMQCAKTEKDERAKRRVGILATASLSALGSNLTFIAHVVLVASVPLLMDALKHSNHDASNLSYTEFKREFDEFVEEERARLGEKGFYERYPIREWLIPEEDKTDD